MSPAGAHAHPHPLEALPSPRLLDGRELSHLLIDLDDCLYQQPKIAARVRQAIQDYLTEHLGVAPSEVAAITQELYARHGTTMAGLAAEGKLAPSEYDRYHELVHGCLDYDSLLAPQPATRRVLADLAVQRVMLTNADAKHAAACLERLQLTDCFQSIYCFENVQALGQAQGLLSPACPILCKPNKACFQAVLRELGVAAACAAFIDDSPRNVAAAHELGIFAILVSPALAAQQQHHVPGADLVLGSFEQLPLVLPQLFVSAAPRLSSEDVPPAAVPVSVLAA